MWLEAVHLDCTTVAELSKALIASWWFATLSDKTLDMMPQLWSAVDEGPGPWLLLRLCSSPKEDLQASSPELAYGEPLYDPR